MQIIHAPHPSLRQVAKPITTVDKKLLSFINEISSTLVNNERRGVGLAAPQVDKSWRLFLTYLSPNDDRGEEDESTPRLLNVFINPRIVKTSPQKELGGTEESRPLEGCLSIPAIYGPVPRFDWVEVEYEMIQGDKLVSAKKKFTEFAARVAQHEIDHLDGILFTDYCLEFDLPIYKENKQGKLKEIDDRSLMELF
jgi:peptide deformylase